jgi:hypothetical protein
MTWRGAKWIGLGAAALSATIFGGWILTLPPSPSFAAAPPIAKEEADATIAALKPPKRQRPLIAIIGINDATETTDYLMPYGILRRADVADVVTLATKPGPMSLFPVLKVEPLALVADAWSRTYRSRAVTFAGTAGAIATRNGIRILPDEVAVNWPAERLLPAIGVAPPAKALDQALSAIEARYGASTSDFVAMQLEYPRQGSPH